MVRTTKAISEALYASVKVALTEVARFGDVSRKLQAIKSSKEYDIKMVAEVFGVSRMAIMAWIKAFSTEGITGLQMKPGRGRKTFLTVEEQEAVRKWLTDDCNLTIQAVKLRIEGEFGKVLGKSATHNLMKSMNFTYITPRPRHHKQDPKLQAEFKKNLQRKCEDNPELELYFFDESRFGTHSNIGHGWFVKGRRTALDVSLGFKNFYLFSAVTPRTGKDVTLQLPKVNTECMNIFREQMACDLGDVEVFLVMDQAGWHRAKGLIIPKNIHIVYLPPYSPELNPVERLWGYIKQHTIKNRVYPTIAALEDAVSQFIISLQPATIASICKFGYT